MGGGWVEERLGARLEVTAVVPEARRWVGSVALGLRRNPRRAHLLVSSLLGKHVPVAASEPLAAGQLLGSRVRAALDEAPVVVGFAETATGLGHAVAAGAGARAALHTTRRAIPAGAAVVEFAEEHSHASEQRLAVLDERLLAGPAPLVLVDDELSTGRTALNAVRAIQQRWPRDRYVVATLLDTRSAARQQEVAAAAAALGVRLDTVALLAGDLHLPGGFAARAEALGLPDLPGPPAPAGQVRRWRWQQPAALPLTGAFGWRPDHEQLLQSAAAEAAAALAGSAVRLVLGDEELLYPAQLLAAALGARTSATTRSPAVVVDAPGYPLRSVVRFPATDDSARTSFAYNVPPATAAALLVDREPSAGAVRALAGVVGTLHVVRAVTGSGAATAVEEDRQC